MINPETCSGLRVAFPSKVNTRAKSPFGILHSDVWGHCCVSFVSIARNSFQRQPHLVLLESVLVLESDDSYLAAVTYYTLYL